MSETKVEGVVRLYVDVHVTTEEMRHWPPSVIERFFAGIAMVQGAVNESRQKSADLGKQPDDLTRAGT